MPEAHQLAEEGEVEDGELPVASNASHSNGRGSETQYRSSSSSRGGMGLNIANKRPSIQIGLSKAVPSRGPPRPSLFEEDTTLRTNRVNEGAPALTIRGAAATGSSGSNHNGHGRVHSLEIRGKSNGSSGDLRHGGVALGNRPSQNNGTPSDSSAPNDQSPMLANRTSLPTQMSIKGTHLPPSLPPKPGSAIAMPFKMKGSSTKPAGTASGAAFPSPMPLHAPSNAIGKGYGNAMIAPRIPSIVEPGPSYTPPPRHVQPSQPKPPSPRQRPPSPPAETRPLSPALPPPPSLPSSLPQRPSSPQDWSSAKGKAKEQEEGEELEEGEEATSNGHSRAGSHDRRTPRSRSTPYGDNRGYSAARSEKYGRYGDEDDDRRKASFGRSQGDRWEPSYRSPRASRYNDRTYEPSSRHHRDHDEHSHSRRRDQDGYHRKSGYESYGDDSRHSRRDRDRVRDNDRDSRGGRDRPARYHDDDRDRRQYDRVDSSRYDQSGSTKGNVWRRGSSYSPDDPYPRTHQQDADFHDDPGAPRHFDRELASVRKSLPGTPSLPAKPGASLPDRSGARPREAPAFIPPPPQAATPFFLPTPPASIPEKAASPWDGEAEPAIKMDVVEAATPKTSEKIQARHFTLFGASSLDEYILEEKLGEGTFGVVHKARRKGGSVATMPQAEHDRRFRKTMKRRLRSRGNMEVQETLCASRVQEGDVVALKKIVMHNDMDGVPITALREIRILKTLNHPNVVPVVDMAYQSGDHASLRRGAVYMVFPYMAHDLAGLLENKKIVTLDQSLLKLYARQLLLGTSYLHRNKILHRDMKAANLLISDEGVLQIADFGLARSIEVQPVQGKRREYTNCVVTRWYRPPELLLGLRAYGCPIDMWGVGCVIGEMFIRHPIFTGSSDLDQISRIVQMCGTIDDSSMPGWEQLPESNVIQVQRGTRNVKREFSRFSDELADLLDKLLVYDPEIRLTADQALDHDWFWTEPMPAKVGSVRAFPSSHEYDKRKAVEERQGQGGEKARAAQEAAFKGPNQAVRPPVAPVRQPHPASRFPPALPVMQADGWGKRQPMQQNVLTQEAMPAMIMAQPPRAGLPPRPVAPQGFLPTQSANYANVAPVAGYPNVSMGMTGPNHVQSMSYSQAASVSMRPQERYPMPPGGSKEIAIAGRSSQAWNRDDPAAKRQRLASPPGRLKGGIAGRSRMGDHADNLGGQALPYRPLEARRSASAYDDQVPAGSAEPLD